MKNLKAAIILLLILLLLPASGLAAQQVSIAEIKEQVAQGWQQTYEAHGRTITVDVLPHVPDVTTVPMVQYAIANLQPSQDNQSQWDYDFGGMPGSVIIMADAKAVTGTRGYVTDNVWHGAYETDRTYIPGNPQTLEQMISMVGEVLSKSGLDSKALYLAHPFSVAQGVYQDKSGVQDAGPGVMIIEFYQSLRGLPLVGDSYKAYLNDMDTNASRSVPGQTSTAMIRNASQFMIFLSALVQETEELAPDLPLAAFDQVKASLEAEIKAGRLRQVFQVTLGYAFFAGKANQAKAPIKWNADDFFYALPVWAVDCIYVDSAQENLTDYSRPEWEGLAQDPYNVLEYRRLLVNAQTGKLIDPMNRSADRVVFPGFLSWAEVKR